MEKKINRFFLWIAVALLSIVIICPKSANAAGRYSYSVKTIGSENNRGRNRKALIRQHDSKTGKTKVIKTIKLKPGDSTDTLEFLSFAGTCGSRMYLNRMYWQNGDGYDIYMLDVKTKKYKKVADKAHVAAHKGKWFVSNYPETVPTEVSLYRSVKSGLKKVKLLARYGKVGCISGNYIYYISYSSQSSNSGAICRIRVDGKKKKIMTRFKNRYITDVTAKGYEYQSGWSSKRVSY